MIHIIDKSKCCGCNACVQRCPKQCISMHEDDEGFLYPKVDITTCINCGICEKVCPMINIGTTRLPQNVIAAKCKNEEIRLASSSGGMFFLLAQAILQENGVVFGAIYDKQWGVKLSYTDQIHGVSPMMGSKYLQATIGTAYQDAERFLKQGRKVLFSGTPCQIAGLHAYLRKEYDNLLSVDFLCHGVPSPGVWRRYLTETLLKRSKNAKISNIEFRNKKQYGWKKFCLVIYTQNNSTEETSKSTLLSDIHYTNPYMKGFLSNLYLRPSCYDCRCKEGVNHSDLTIADFWGINEVIPAFDDDKGISLVLTYTQKGDDIIHQLPIEIRRSSLYDAIRRNGGYYSQAQWNPKRHKFFKAYHKGKEPIDHIVNRLLHKPLWRKIASRIKRFLLQQIKNK